MQLGSSDATGDLADTIYRVRNLVLMVLAEDFGSKWRDERVSEMTEHNYVL